MPHTRTKGLPGLVSPLVAVTSRERCASSVGLAIVASVLMLASASRAIAAANGPEARPAHKVGAPNGAAAQPPAPPPAPVEPSAEQIQKARQLIFAIGVPDAFEVSVADATAQIAAAFTQAHPDLTTDINNVVDGLRPEFAKQVDTMVDVTARFYASEFSEEDLDTILAFFNSEAGRKWNAAQRDIYKQLTSGIQAWQQKIIVTMVARVRQEMKKKGHDL